MYQPLLRERFLDELPESLVCILSERRDCSLEAELTRIAISASQGPLRSFMASARSQTCPRSKSSTSSSFLTSYFRVEDTTLNQINAFEDMLITALLNINATNNFISSWNNFIDLTMPPIVSYVSDFLVKVLQTPMDFIKIALQLGIDIPALDQREQCPQGDVKQLLMWGMLHNLNWSFSEAILDMFFAPEPPLCGFPGADCQSTPQFSRSLPSNTDDPNHLLSCDRTKLAHLNATMCAELLQAPPQTPSTLSTLCKTLNWLSPEEVKRVWGNSCYAVQSLLAPFLDEAACSQDAPSPETLPQAQQDPSSSSTTTTLRRVARSNRSLKELLCVYENWTEPGAVDPSTVTLCAENFQEGFVPHVCRDVQMFSTLLADAKNMWLWGYCFNNSQDFMVSQHCAYDTWTLDKTQPTLVTLCWTFEHERFEELLCGFNLEFFNLIFSNPKNTWLRPNCTQPPEQVDVVTLVAEACQYGAWDVMAPITAEQLSVCIQNDESGFRGHVCGNATFLAVLLKNGALGWVKEFCTSASPIPPTEPPQISILDWCDYAQWGENPIDSSVVGLCWQMDQLGFQKNVCCNVALFERLTLDPLNEWLTSVCTEEKEKDNIVAQTCLYSEWTRPIIVDMTDLALCADKDTENFTQKVCLDRVVLRNLLANLDNTWLLPHCANHSDIDGGIDPAQHCQYRSWVVALPDSFLLAFCWDYDQANFVSSVCTNPSVLSLLRQESSSVWVGTLCAPYTPSPGGNTATSTSSAPPSSTTSSPPTTSSSSPPTTSSSSPPNTPPYPCPIREVVRKLNWSCSADFNAVCHPGASELQALQMLVRCGMEVLQPRVDSLLTQNVASVLGQASSLSVVLLVALEESKLTSIRVMENIRLSVLESVQRYMEKESNFDNKRILLQCFGKVLTSLMQTGRDVPSDTSFLIKEYFRIPLDKLRAVLSALDTSTLRTILQYFNRNRDALELSDAYLQTMVSVLFHTHLARDASLFSDLTDLFAIASPADIQALPATQSDPKVLWTINSLLPSLSAERRSAFGRWFARAVGPANLTAGSLSFISDTGNLIAYLPFHRFQHLSPAQLLDGLDVLLRNTLTPLQQRFMAQSLTGTFQNLTADQLRRLGNVTCLANSKDLMQYVGTEAFTAIQKNVRECVAQGLRVPSNMVSSVILAVSNLSSPSTLSAESLSELSYFLPQLGTDFLSKLSQSQLDSALPSLASVPFSPAQAGVIMDKLSTTVILTQPGGLSTLGSLVSGVRVETLWGIPSDSLLSALPNISLHQHGLSPPQANAITTKLWGSPEVTSWLDKLEPFLSSTPLLSMLPRKSRLISNITSAGTKAWTTQQAIALFEEAQKQKKSVMSVQDFMQLGTIAPGVSCSAMNRMFKDTPSLDSMLEVLHFLRSQPVPLHTSLKKCIIDELYQFDFFSDLLGELGAQIALSLPVSTIKKFPSPMMDDLRKMVLQEPRFFMLLPTTKQLLLVDKMLQRLNMYTGVYTEEEFRGLGVMATYAADDIFVQVDRQFFLDSLEHLQGLCYVGTKQGLVAQILQEDSTFGPVQNWTSDVLIQVRRFLFFLSKDKLQLIPSAMMTQERIERLFMSQQQWEEESKFGALCMQSMTVQERQELFEKQQFVLQFFLGFLRVDRAPSTLVPSCESLYVTRTSAWSMDSLTSMPAASFARCLELMGRDRYLTAYQLQTLLQRAKEVYGSASSLSPSVIGQLGRLSSQFSVEELGQLNLSELRAVAALGDINSWSSRQLSVLFLTVLNSSKLTPSQLDSSTLVALGYIICGLEAPLMRNLNAVEFSKAVLWLGRLRLQCSEDQQRALVGLLSHSLAFGQIGTWGTSEFLEIGAVAVGLSDMEMSSLVREQIEGLTPLAVSLIPPEKFAVVFRPVQISMFSYGQAIVVTKAQHSALTAEQQTALSMVLNPWKDKPVDFRGRSSGVAVFPCPLCHLGELLMLLSLQLLFASQA
ncbi:stereocilin isoform X2 [Clupea harengus]|uniref:Stereocilin isoform X2 n=1 Tax=Clupea harengus TaxID=7950 RepID=A0A6P8EN02_CLUHA|nr:stereocilin isoform X2 [Clupea harengus]